MAELNEMKYEDEISFQKENELIKDIEQSVHEQMANERSELEYEPEAVPLLRSPERSGVENESEAVQLPRSPERSELEYDPEVVPFLRSPEVVEQHGVNTSQKELEKMLEEMTEEEIEQEIGLITQNHIPDDKRPIKNSTSLISKDVLQTVNSCDIASYIISIDNTDGTVYDINVSYGEYADNSIFYCSANVTNLLHNHVTIDKVLLGFFISKDTPKDILEKALMSDCDNPSKEKMDDFIHYITTFYEEYMDRKGALAIERLIVQPLINMKICPHFIRLFSFNVSCPYISINNLISEKLHNITDNTRDNMLRITCNAPELFHNV